MSCVQMSWFVSILRTKLVEICNELCRRYDVDPEAIHYDFSAPCEFLVTCDEVLGLTYDRISKMAVIRVLSTRNEIGYL